MVLKWDVRWSDVHILLAILGLMKSDFGLSDTTEDQHVRNVVLLLALKT